MALDTITIKLLTDELSQKLMGGKIEKVYQPENDEIVLLIKTFTASFRLVISANASHPRIHITSVHKENPQKAPLFCMLLRKHLQGGKIIGITQADYERIVKIDIDSYDELGDKTTKHLICEFMGRHSNIILTKADNTVIDSVKRVDFSVSSVRQILPGIVYSAPPAQEKYPILKDGLEYDLFDFSKEGKSAENIIMDTVSGISPLHAREIVFLATKKTATDSSQLSELDKKNIFDKIKSFYKSEIKPVIVYDKDSGKSIDFSPFDIMQYSNLCKKEYFEDLNTLLDCFYKNRDNTERMKQKSTDLVHLLNTNIERVSKKLAILKKTVTDAKKKEEYKQKGDLLSSNIHLISQGDTEIIVDNYYEENCPKISVMLNPMLTPSQNVLRYYKLYQKAKTAEIEAAKQFDTAVSDLEYLESTLVLTKNAQSEADINAIRNELSLLGYTKNKNSKKQKNANISKPHHYISSDGFDIYVGKNNMQNDYLTLKFANSSDIWFHTKQIHGSHTVIKLGVDKNVPDTTIKEAAALAAYYSKARQSSNVPVDYTQIKNVKKPNGAKPGMVIYDHYNTIYINPSDENIKKSPE